MTKPACEGRLDPDIGPAAVKVNIAAQPLRSIDLYHQCPFYPQVQLVKRGIKSTRELMQ
jgi:hypothetical protein